MFLFLENWQFNQKLGLPLSSTNILCRKDLPHNLTKYEIKETSKVRISQLFCEKFGRQKKLKRNWQKFGSATLGIYAKIPIFHLFQELLKIKKSR